MIYNSRQKYFKITKKITSSSDQNPKPDLMTEYYKIHIETKNNWKIILKSIYF